MTTLRMDQYVGGSWQPVDLEAVRLANPKPTMSYSHPSQLTFSLRMAQHTTPIPAYAGIRIWDEAALDAEGAAFDSANPLFLGFVEDIDPAESNRLDYTCLDPTARANSQVQVMSTAWDSPTEPGPAANCRLVFNAAVDGDPDWTFSRGLNLTIGQMIAIMLDDAQLPLEQIFAAGASAYEAADLELLTYIPQEKIVFTSEPIRSAIVRLLDSWAPEFRLLFDPKTRKWRFPHIGASSELTYTLNDFRPAVAHPVLQVQLDRSLEDRYTAVQIYGPEAVENRTVTLSGGGLEDVSDGGVLETYGAGSQVLGKNKFRIADDTKRRMGRLLAEPIYAPLEEQRIGPGAWTQFAMWTRFPSLQVHYPFTSAGTDNWQTIRNDAWYYDPETGIIDLRDTYLYRYNYQPDVPSGDPHYENPTPDRGGDVRLIYPSFLEPLFVRAPASGFAGTAYTAHGLANELKIYDESLAIGFMRGTPVTSATRLEKFAVLALAMLEAKKNVLYHGGMTLEGIDYSFQHLGRRVNIAAVNRDGEELVTGWEEIAAIVTDWEIDFENQSTTVNFSSDQSELLGFDPARIKEQLRVGAAYISQIVTAYATLGTFQAYTELGTPYLAQSLTVGGSVTPVAVDPFFGTVDPLIS